jgi:aryl-alcohol dehydrogenase-like predicted oxidoreductase
VDRPHRWPPHFISAQNEYSWLKREIETGLVPALEKYGIGLLPYFPLANGLLTGKYRRGEAAPAGSRLVGRDSELSAERFDLIEKLEAFAAGRGIGLLDVAVGGLAAKPTVASVIAGATSPEQVQANVAAGAWKPSTEDLALLDEITG